jgi:hypothetical protein
MSCDFEALRIQGMSQAVLRRTGPPLNPTTEQGFGLTQGGSFVELLSGTPPTSSRLVVMSTTWSPDALLVQLPMPFPAAPNQIRITIVGATGTTQCTATANIDLSDTLINPLLYVVAVPPAAPLGSQVFLVGGLPGFQFHETEHSPIVLNCAVGTGSANLTASARGWGTNILTVTLPGSYMCDLVATPTSMIRLGMSSTGIPLIVLAALPSTGPLQGRFRLVLNGFRVEHETADHVLEVDGKGDEVFFQIHVAEVNVVAGSVSTVTKVSKTFGDISGFPDRVQAGSRSLQGGLKTTDAVGTHARGAVDPTPNRLPMSLWEGTLQQGLTGVVVVPTVWETDLSTDSTLRQPDWPIALGALGTSTVTAAANAVLSRLSLVQNVPLPTGAIVNHDEIIKTDRLPALRITRDPVGLFGRAGDVPIGFNRAASVPGTPDKEELFPQMVVLTYETALLASRTPLSPPEPNGVFTIRYSGENMHWNEGDYTLFLQVEEVT